MATFLGSLIYTKKIIEPTFSCIEGLAQPIIFDLLVGDVSGILILMFCQQVGKFLKGTPGVGGSVEGGADSQVGKADAA